MLRQKRITQRLKASLSFRQLGFTLIELMMAIVIATVLMMVAVPSYVTFQQNAKLSDTVSNFISAANTTRANAMKQGLNTYMLPNNAGTGWSSGWIVFADSNWNQVYDAGTDEVVLRHDSLSSDIILNIPNGSSFADASPYLLFNGSGYPRLKSGGFGGGTINISNASRSSSIIIDPAGRVRSCKTGSTGCYIPPP